MGAQALVFGLACCGPATASPARLFIVPFSYLDTSGEPRDQRAEHGDRLATMSRDLASNLGGSGLYDVVAPPEGSPACDTNATDCILAQARKANADLVLAGAVQKVSTMATSMWIGAFEAATGKRVFYRQMTFRGDTDDAWQHATAFMTREIKDDPPRAP